MIKQRLYSLLRSRSVITGVAALSFGLLAAILGEAWIDQRLDAQKRRWFPEQDFREVLVADRPLSAGDPVDSSSVSILKLPTRWLPGGTLSPEQFSQVDGRQLRRAIVAGTPITDSDVSEERAPSDLTAVRSGFRLVALPSSLSPDTLAALSDGETLDIWDSSPVKPGGLLDGGSFQVVGADEHQGRPVLLVEAARVLGGQAVKSRDRHGRSSGGMFIEIPQALVGRYIAAQARGGIGFSLRGRRDTLSASISASNRLPYQGGPVEIIVHNRPETL
ncbi:MAG: hypothetical protein EBT03_03200 [Betaproteobacteria bacterium]|nr:hypothetical protein [Betaproteobacteria bacterium]